MSHIYFVKKSIDQYVNKKEVILFKSCSSTQELRNKGNGSFSRKAFRAFVEVQTYTWQASTIYKFDLLSNIVKISPSLFFRI